MNRNPHVFDNQTDDLFVQPTGGPPQASPLFFYILLLAIVQKRFSHVGQCSPIMMSPLCLSLFCFFNTSTSPSKKEKEKTFPNEP